MLSNIRDGVVFTSTDYLNNKSFAALVGLFEETKTHSLKDRYARCYLKYYPVYILKCVRFALRRTQVNDDRLNGLLFFFTFTWPTGVQFNIRATPLPITRVEFTSYCK